MLLLTLNLTHRLFYLKRTVMVYASSITKRKKKTLINLTVSLIATLFFSLSKITLMGNYLFALEMIISVFCGHFYRPGHFKRNV